MISPRTLTVLEALIRLADSHSHTRPCAEIALVPCLTFVMCTCEVYSNPHSSKPDFVRIGYREELSGICDVSRLVDKEPKIST